MEKMSKQQEKEMLKSKQMIRCFRLFFFLIWEASPLWTEQWLNSMQQKGYIVYKITRLRIVYFIKSDVKETYAVDYQPKCTDKYISHHQDCGWTLVSHKNAWPGIVVWSKELQPDSTPPVFFSESQSKLDLIRRMLKAVTIASIIICLSFLLIFAISANIRGQGWEYVRSTALIMFALEVVTVSVLITIYLLERKRVDLGSLSRRLLPNSSSF